MLSEFSLREIALDDHKISFMFLGGKWGDSRKSVNFKCNENCVLLLDRLPTGNEGFISVKNFRRSLWIDPELLGSETKLRINKGWDIRKSALF